MQYNDGQFKIEEFWIVVFNTKNLSFKVLARFMINLLVKPHSNTFVERMFSQVNLIKDETRNLLDVAIIL